MIRNSLLSIFILSSIVSCSSTNQIDTQIVLENQPPEAKPKNEIWLSGGKLCVVSDPLWVIIMHFGFEDYSRLAFQIIERGEKATDPAIGRCLIDPYILEGEHHAHELSSEFLDKPTENARITFYEGWIIMSWSGDIEGNLHNIIEARAVNRKSSIAVTCTIDWEICSEVPEDYDRRMDAALKSVISQLKTQSSAFEADPPNLH